MTDFSCTLPSPLSGPAGAARALLVLTLVWHPDPARIGEQSLLAADGDGVLLNRYAPLFGRPGQPGQGLGHGGISREPIRIVRADDDSVRFTLPASRMAVELNGRPVAGTVLLGAADVSSGAILALGRAVLLCVHWMTALPRDNPVPGIAGVGSAASALRQQIRLVAPTDMTVLLLGETGSGKEAAARAIHGLGERAGAPLVAVNMAALNEALAAADLFGAVRGAYTGAQAERKGVFGEADGATLFLDEIGSAPAAVQPMLLRVLEGGYYRPLGASQDRRSSARLVAATDQDLGGSFNQALRRRLESFVIALPPLRQRREDIGVLILHLLDDPAQAALLPCALVAEMAAYDWPGNVRQLAHVVRRAVLMLAAGVPVRLDELTGKGACVQAGPALPEAPAAVPRRKPSSLSEQEVLDALASHRWAIGSAARALGISRPSMYKLIEGHSRIRRPQDIPPGELQRALAASGGQLVGCAALLETPGEPLRRHLRRLSMLA